MNDAYISWREENSSSVGWSDREKDSRFTRAKLESQSASTISWCPCFFFISVLSWFSTPTRIEVTFTLLFGRLEAFWMRIKLLILHTPPALLKCSDHCFPSWPRNPLHPLQFPPPDTHCFFGEPMRSRHHASADSSRRPIGLRHVGTCQQRQPINGEYHDDIICDRRIVGWVSSLPTELFDSWAVWLKWEQGVGGKSRLKHNKDEASRFRILIILFVWSSD